MNAADAVGLAQPETNAPSEDVVGIDHIAVAVDDLAAAVEWARGTLGCALIEERVTHGQRTGMRSAVLRLGGFALVLVQGTGAESQVSQFVQRHGPGVQHIALRVRDLTRVLADMERRGMRFSTPRLDSERLSQVFSDRDATTGLMVELIERRDYEGFSDENVQRLFDSLESKGLY